MNKLDTADRLQQYFGFDTDVLTRVSAAAEKQNSENFTTLTRQYGIEDGPQVVRPYGNDNPPIEVLTINPDRIPFHETTTRVYHTPVGNPISDNMAMRAIRMFETDRESPLVVFGNQFGIWMPHERAQAGKVSSFDAKRMRKSHTLIPRVEPQLRWLADKGAVHTSQLGFSYGADETAVASAESPRYNQTVDSGVMIEPSSLEAQPRKKLAVRFLASNKELWNYINDANSPPYNETRAREKQFPWNVSGGLNYFGGLLRATNRAIVSVLGNGGFEERARTAIEANPDGYFSMGWGSLSELVSEQPAVRTANRLLLAYGEERFGYMLLNGMHHAGGDDIDLHAAIMLQGQKRPTSPSA